MDVSGFWTGAAATAFTQLRDRVVPAVRGLASMHTEAGAALGTWQRHLAVYQEDTAGAITLGRQGWAHYQTSCQAQPAGRTTMNAAKAAISNAVALRDGSGRTCKTAIEAATAKADVAAQPTGQAGQQPQFANPAHPPIANQISTVPGQVGRAPSGREPVPMIGVFRAGEPWPYVDPANGRVVRPVPGPWAVGQQPWEYVTPGG